MHTESWEDGARKARSRAREGAVDLGVNLSPSAHPVASPAETPPRGTHPLPAPAWEADDPKPPPLFARQGPGRRRLCLRDYHRRIRRSFRTRRWSLSLLCRGPAQGEGSGGEASAEALVAGLEARGIPQYGIIALLEKYGAKKLFVEPGMTKKHVEAINNYRELLASMAASLPPDSDEGARALMYQLLDYFKEDQVQDIIDLWIECRTGAEPFAEEGTTPRDILLGLGAILKSLDIKPARKLSLRSYIWTYRTWREQDHLSDVQTLAFLLERQIFRQ